MRGKLKELIIKLTSDKPTTSYVEDVAVALASTARWTCPADGLIVARVVSSGGVVGYYIYDVTAGDKPICNLYDNERYNNTASTTCFPVIKGHVYRQAYYAGQMREALYYRFGMGGYCLAVFSRLCAILKIGGGVDETETERTPHQNACALDSNIFKQCTVVRKLAHFHRRSLCKQYGSIHYTISCEHFFTSHLCNSILWTRWLRCIRHHQHNQFIDHINNTVPIQFSRCRNGSFRGCDWTGITPERGCAV